MANAPSSGLQLVQLQSLLFKANLYHFPDASVGTVLEGGFQVINVRPDLLAISASRDIGGIVPQGKARQKGQSGVHGAQDVS
jgi:hypothetical protein